MPISLILSLVGPVVVKLLTSLVDRFWNHGVSTIQGTVAGAGALAFLNSIGCDLSLAQQGVIGAISAAPGLLSTDPSKMAAPLLQSALDQIKDAKEKNFPPSKISGDNA